MELNSSIFHGEVDNVNRNTLITSKTALELPLAFRESQAKESKRAIAHHAPSLITALHGAPGPWKTYPQFMRTIYFSPLRRWIAKA